MYRYDSTVALSQQGDDRVKTSMSIVDILFCTLTFFRDDSSRTQAIWLREAAKTGGSDRLLLHNRQSVPGSSSGEAGRAG